MPEYIGYQQRFNARLYEPGVLARLTARLPERVRMWSPWWLRHVVAVERTLHDRTMDEARGEDCHGHRLSPTTEPTEDTRCDQYRDLLEHWAAWWNGPGREHYHFNLLPPITKTGEALRCSICAGESGEGRCAACGRRMS